jgi:hypothetical protein
MPSSSVETRSATMSAKFGDVVIEVDASIETVKEVMEWLDEFPNTALAGAYESAGSQFRRVPGCLRMSHTIANRICLALEAHDPPLMKHQRPAGVRGNSLLRDLTPEGVKLLAAMQRAEEEVKRP